MIREPWLILHRHRLLLAVIPLEIYALILLPLRPFSAKMAVSPRADAALAAAGRGHVHRSSPAVALVPAGHHPDVPVVA